MLLTIGELIERKNQEVIIEAIADMEDPNIKYVICGIGPLEFLSFFSKIFSLFF